MPTRRTTLKTLAGGAVVGSLSGCVQVATQRTTHFHGTPAMVSEIESGGSLSELQPFSAAVGVEAHRTVERFGITKEIVAHNWGMLYRNGTTAVENPPSVIDNPPSGQPGSVATFTTPSIQIAGQELNPIKDLTVGDIAQEFLSITETSLGSNEETLRSSKPQPLLATKSVNDANGKKVLREFRDSAALSWATSPGDADNYTATEFDFSEVPQGQQTVPEWDGDTYSASLQDPAAIERSVTLGFHKHDGDFVVLFAAGDDMASVDLTVGGSQRDSRFIHPSNDQFSRDKLNLHLLKTNLRGTLGLVKQGLKLIDETQELVKMNEYDRQTLIQAVSGIQDTISEIRETLRGCDSDACKTVLRHASDTRPPLARKARDALENGNPGTAQRSLQELAGIIEEDITLLEAQEGESAERALRLERTLLEDTERASQSAAQWQVLLRTNEGLKRFDSIMGDLEEGLSALTNEVDDGGLDAVEKYYDEADLPPKIEKAVETASDAHERVASHNDTRDEEDDRFVAIERNLDILVGLSRTIKRTVANGRKTVKARDV